MKESSTQEVTSVIGIDLGDRYCRWCEIDSITGEKLDEGRIVMCRRSIERLFKDRPRARVVIEVGAQSAWVARCAAAEGHEVIVANARRVALISKNDRKNDRTDAETLARLGRIDPELLHPVIHRSESVQRDRSLLRARDGLVQCRTCLINLTRSTVKVFGERLPTCSSRSFVDKVSARIPAGLEAALEPILPMIAKLTEGILAYDKQIETRAKQEYPITELLRQVKGVGPLTSLSFVLTIEDPSHFRKSRDVGPYLGLVPKQHQSGNRDPELRITRAGDKVTRHLLVQSAQYMLGPFGDDCDLRRYGERIATRGGKYAKQRAVVAVARKLAVLLHHLMVTGEDYEPLYATHLQEAAA